MLLKVTTSAQQTYSYYSAYNGTDKDPQVYLFCPKYHDFLRDLLTYLIYKDFCSIIKNSCNSNV